MTEEERLAEIEKLAKNQLSHKKDLPPRRRTRTNGKRVRVTEVPYNPFVMGIIAISGGKIYHWKSSPPRPWPGYTVKGRYWTISS